MRHEKSGFVIRVFSHETMLFIGSLIALVRHEVYGFSALAVYLIRSHRKLSASNKIRLDVSFFFALIGFVCVIHTDSVRADLAQCPRDSQIVNSLGQKVDIERLWGFHISTQFRDGACRADTLEGLIWWRSGQITSVAPENKNGWTPFKIVFGFSQGGRDSHIQGGGNTKERPRGTLRAPEWKGQEFTLDYYPGLIIRLKEGLAMTEASNFNGDFILDRWRGEGGNRKIVICSTVVTNHKKSAIPLLSGEELKIHKFENDFDWCELDLPDFSMASGAGRVLFSGDKLREAATALPKIYEYIQSTTIKKEI
ncbi:hypothetical protein [Pseudomonas typographi]|uniref:hypothetical protein n=1 Tax=Pseudomonas typographi TaxID=2715964 RepID=UPI0016880C0B|nr:hypothetical protein [Pseudomonas typographi]MBD1553151.1 hypothetical protein [Pseudomonas typographi]MBD1585861.1 hypothetical protein [Pseudomonas typographi]